MCNSVLVHLVALVETRASAAGHCDEFLCESDGEIRGDPGVSTLDDPFPRDTVSLALVQGHGYLCGLCDARVEGFDQHERC